MVSDLVRESTNRCEEITIRAHYHSGVGIHICGVVFLRRRAGETEETQSQRELVEVKTMMNSRTGVTFVALVLWGPLCSEANAQSVSMPAPNVKQQVLSLNFA